MPEHETAPGRPARSSPPGRQNLRALPAGSDRRAADLAAVADLQSLAGNRAVAGVLQRAVPVGGSPRRPSHQRVTAPTSGPASVQRAPSGPGGPPDHATSSSAAPLSSSAPTLEANLAAPLTEQEMYNVLLSRRATPLSIPASQVNEAPGRIVQIDHELAELQPRFKRARGNPRVLIQNRIADLRAERLRLARGHALGTIGAGAPAGTGRITYAAIQVIDAQGRRIALEFAETSSQEHAEEIIVGRLRASLTAEQLRGARILVVTDQKVCDQRCQPALRKFAEDFQVESVEAKLFVRPKASGTGDATARTTLRSSTTPTSENLPVTEVAQSIYRRAGASSLSSAPAAAPEEGLQSGRSALPAVAAPEESLPSGQGAAPETTRPNAGKSAVAEGGEKPGPGRTGLTLGSRMRTTGLHVGGMIVFDLLLDLASAKIKEWLDNAKFKAAMTALAPTIEAAKSAALQRYEQAAAASVGPGYFYNVRIRVTVSSTMAIAGGHAAHMVGFPTPTLEGVTISADDAKADGPVVEEAHVLHGAAVIQTSRTQVLTYSEPVQ